MFHTQENVHWCLLNVLIINRKKTFSQTDTKKVLILCKTTEKLFKDLVSSGRQRTITACQKKKKLKEGGGGFECRHNKSILAVVLPFANDCTIKEMCKLYVVHSGDAGIL